MGVIHISEAEAGRDFAGLMARVWAGTEVAIESGSGTVAVLKMPVPERRSIAECLARMPEESDATLDESFARDLEEAVSVHREPLNSSAWD